MLSILKVCTNLEVAVGLTNFVAEKIQTNYEQVT